MLGKSVPGRENRACTESGGQRVDIPEVERRGRESKGSWVRGRGPVRAGGQGRGLWSPAQERDTKGLSQQSCSGGLRAEVKLGERIRPGEGSQTGAQEARRGRAEGGWLCWEAVWACREDQVLGDLKRSTTREQQEAVWAPLTGSTRRRGWVQRGTLLWPCPSEAGGAPLSCPGNSSSTKAGPGVGEGGDPGPKNKGQKKKILGLGQLDIHMNLDPYLIQKNTSRRIMAYLSWVRLSATPWTVAHQAPLSMDSPGKNTGVGCHAFLQGSFQPRDHTCVLCLLHWQVGSVPLAPPGDPQMDRRFKYQ